MATWMDEYIKREDVLRVYEEEQRRNGSWRFETLIESVPSADVEPVRHGRWVHKIVLGGYSWFCSECEAIGSPAWRRCPLCEAKMDGECDAERN